MRDLAFVAFLLAFIGVGIRRPFLLVLAYCYVDIVAPQRLSYFLVNSIPVALVTFTLAFGAWIVADDKKDVRFAMRQFLLFLLLIYCWLTTMAADYPVEAAEKWSWVWKALLWGIFLPLTLRTKLRIEALALTLVLCASSIIVTGGIKTAAGGGGYGTLSLLVSDNFGLYEGSTASMAAIAIIPIILWLRKYGTIFGRTDLEKKWVNIFAYSLCLACLLIPIGTQTRTGLLCIALLVVLGLRDTQRRALYIVGVSIALAVGAAMVPNTYSQRMETIQGHKSDQSASTRVAVWKWTWEYAKTHPFGGGFEAYRSNNFVLELENTNPQAGESRTQRVVEKSRAYHSAYFELLGEQGYPGFLLWAIFNVVGLVQMGMIRRKYKNASESDAWVRPLATALQHSHLVYLLAAAFIGIAFQPFIYMIFALQIGLHVYLRRLERAKAFGHNGAFTSSQMPGAV